VRLLKDPALQQTLSANGRKLIDSRYRWSHVAAQYEALYERIKRLPKNI
jgi:glycosyltransferase involved in cell wall biosynthesis